MSAPPDRSLLRRWLTALGLVTMAEELVGRGDDAASSSALIVADSASETLLGILATWSTKPLPASPKHYELIEAAADSLRAIGGMPRALSKDLTASHNTRNNVVHHGATSTPTDAAISCTCARRLLELLAGVSSHFGVVSAGSGVVAGIATVIDAPDVTAQLLAGEVALSDGDASAAADAASRALAMMLRRLDPPVSADEYRHSHIASHEEREMGRATAKRIEALSTSMAEIQGWVAASALGLHPAEYRRLRRVIGRHTWYLGGNDDVRREADPTLDDARAALVQVAEMVFRTWELGGLVKGTEDDVFERRYGHRRP